jgi:hypothetical protein
MSSRNAPNDCPHSDPDHRSDHLAPVFLSGFESRRDHAGQKAKRVTAGSVAHGFSSPGEASQRR